MKDDGEISDNSKLKKQFKIQMKKGKLLLSCCSAFIMFNGFKIDAQFHKAMRKSAK